MDEYLLIGSFLSIPVGIGLLLYFVPSKLGLPKLGKYLTFGYGMIVLAVVFLVVFKDQHFKTGDAKELLEEQGIFLKESFELKENRSTVAIGDYYHTFTLKISEQDKMSAIAAIKISSDFKRDTSSIVDLMSGSTNRYTGPKQIQNYETESAYVREYFQPSGQEGYAPTFRRISISKSKDELSFEDIDE